MTHSLLIPARGPRFAHRMTRLIAGGVLCGLGVGLMLQSGLGVAPWDVLHQGLAIRFGLTVGLWSIIVSIAVLLAWVPLHQPYGIGTISDAVLVGLLIDLATVTIPRPDSLVGQFLMLGTGLVAIGVGSGLYLSAGLGPGSRDGLMTGIARLGPSIRLTRTTLDVSVLVIGALLGGTYGLGTVAFALGMGPLVHFFLGRFSLDRPSPVRP